MKANIIPIDILNVLKANPQIGRIELAEKTGIPESEARNYCWLYKKYQQKKGGIKKGVVFFDYHYPDHDDACTKIGMKFLANFRPDIFILGGDQLDMGTISSWNKKKPRLTENKRLKREYKGFQRDILDKLPLPRKCQKIWLTGNHEQRVQWLIESSTQFEGFIEPENNLDLSKWDIKKFGEVVQFGEMLIAHGVNYNAHHAKKNVMTYGTNIFTGHVHTSQVFTTQSPTQQLPRQGVSVGCLCNKNPDYRSEQPNAWLHQFLIFWIFSDGSFAYETPTIINGNAIICGKHYWITEEGECSCSNV